MKIFRETEQAYYQPINISKKKSTDFKKFSYDESVCVIMCKIWKPETLKQDRFLRYDISLS